MFGYNDDYWADDDGAPAIGAMCEERTKEIYLDERDIAERFAEKWQMESFFERGDDPEDFEDWLPWREERGKSWIGDIVEQNLRRDSSGMSTLTMGEWSAIKHACGGCLYCGETDAALQLEHVRPVSRGGATNAENVVAACRRCNRSKHAKTAEEWLEPEQYQEFEMRRNAVLSAVDEYRGKVH